jgi:hypothetical protein
MYVRGTECIKQIYQSVYEGTASLVSLDTHHYQSWRKYHLNLSLYAHKSDGRKSCTYALHAYGTDKSVRMLASNVIWNTCASATPSVSTASTSLCSLRTTYLFHGLGPMTCDDSYWVYKHEAGLPTIQPRRSFIWIILTSTFGSLKLFLSISIIF